MEFSDKIKACYLRSTDSILVAALIIPTKKARLCEHKASRLFTPPTSEAIVGLQVSYPKKFSNPLLVAIVFAAVCTRLYDLSSLIYFLLPTMFLLSITKTIPTFRFRRFVPAFITCLLAVSTVSTPIKYSIAPKAML